jgi:hypothetical protein
MNLINLSLTALSIPKFFFWGGQMAAVNVCAGCVACTLNTRYEYMGDSDFYSLAHFPKTVILYEYDL